MSNPLYNQMSGMGGSSDVVSRFIQFRKSFQGNPQQIVQSMVSSGRISQAQLDQAMQTAERLKSIIK
jgi:hypothetical protein